MRTDLSDLIHRHGLPPQDEEAVRRLVRALEAEGYHGDHANAADHAETNEAIAAVLRSVDRTPLERAAPKLLAACRAVLRLGFHGHWTESPYYDEHIEPVVMQLHDAIAEATQEAPCAP